MVPSLLTTTGGLLLLFSLSSAQIRGDSIALCNPNDGFGQYCPTTCGVADYLSTYHSDADSELDRMLQDLDIISNWTQNAEKTAEYMKDSVTMAQKSSTSDTYYKKSSNMLDDVTRFQLTIFQQEQDIIKLQRLISSNEEKMANLKNSALMLQQQCNKPCEDEVKIQTITGEDCQDIANKGAMDSGLYFVKPAKATEQFLVYCEIDSQGRGFTVIQRRRDGSVDFNKDWIQYKEGFGYLSPDDTTEFWLGNEKMHLLTADPSTIPKVLRIELIDWAGNKRYADYNMFKVGSEADKYRLTYGYYFGGDAGDAFGGHDFGDDPSDKFYTSHNGMMFSTYDSDNDNFHDNCALQEGSGWWMNRCHAAHLNGKYYIGGSYKPKDAGEHGYDNGIIWATWHNRWYSLKETTMKIIPLTRIIGGGGQQTGVKQFGGLES